MAHADDFEYAPLIAVLAPFHDTFVPEHVIETLKKFPGDHLVETSAYAPPKDVAVRNITTWVSANLTHGAMSFVDDNQETELRSSQWNAAVIQWARSDSSVGFFTQRTTEHAMDVDVAPGYMNLSYPKGGQESTFQFLVSPNPMGARRDIFSLDDISGVEIKASGSVNATPIVTFCGLAGGNCDIKL